MESWKKYRAAFEPLAETGRIELQTIPEDCEHNGHMFYIKCRDLEDRTAFLSYVRSREIGCVFHYIPLHSAPAGLRFGRFHGEDRYTTKESERLVRLPMYYGLSEEDREEVIRTAMEALA